MGVTGLAPSQEKLLRKGGVSQELWKMLEFGQVEIVIQVAQIVQAEMLK